MTRAAWIAAGAGAVGLVTLAALQSQQETPKLQVAPTPTGTGWVNPAAPAEVRALASRVTAITGWTNLPDFLVAVAYWESRGNHLACAGECGPGFSRGWFQLRPGSARTSDFGSVNLLFNKRWSVALAAWYGYRLRNYAKAGQIIDFLALRRGWKLPSLVADTIESNPESRRIRERFAIALGRVGLPTSFMYRPAFPSGFYWPGINSILNAVDAPPASSVS